MSTEVLKRAAALMRERAEAASDPAWSAGGIWWEHWTDPERRKCHTPWPLVTRGTGADMVAKTTSEHDARHIASWHPAVALAVADLLDAQAAIIGDSPGFFDIGEMGDANALAVAVAYLGESA